MSLILQSPIYTMIPLWNHAGKIISVACFFEHYHPSLLSFCKFCFSWPEFPSTPLHHLTSMWRYLTSFSNQYCNPWLFLHTSQFFCDHCEYDERFCVVYACMLCILLAAQKQYYHLVVTSLGTISCLLFKRSTQKEVSWLFYITKKVSIT